MKQINKLFILSILSLSTFTACSDLDQNPVNQLSISKGFRSVDDAAAWANHYYAVLRRNFGSSEMLAELQADVFNASIAYGNRYGSLHTWTIQSGDGSVELPWTNYYTALADINICIDRFPQIPTASVQERQQLNLYLGEAYALRAYYYSKLLEFYSPQYSEANKNTPDLGLPLVLTYDIGAKPARATIEATYNQIYADIAAAKEYLSGKQNEVGALSFTPDAITALQARVALNKGDYNTALTAASQLIQSGRYPLVTDRETLLEVWKNDDSQESIVQLFASSNVYELPPNRDNYLNYRAGIQKYTAFFVPSQWVVDLYEANDIRTGVYVKELPCFLEGNTYDLTLAYKYPQNKYVSYPHYGHAPKIFRIAEQYLIAAEAAYKLGNENDAKAYLNALRSARAVADITTSGTALFTDIKSERLRELAFEGFRLSDLKRWGDPVRRHDPQNLTYITKSPPSQYHELNKPATDPMFTWPIPYNDLRTNPNLKQNPGY